MKKKQLYKFILLFTVIIGSLSIISLFFFYKSEIILSFTQFEGMWSIAIFILIRISITIGMTLFIFQQWFKQKNLYLSDIHFLFGIFFLGLVFGKLLNLLYILICLNAEEDTILILLKIRYILIILTSAPLVFLGIDLILFSLSKNQKEFANNRRIIYSFIIMTIIVFIQSLFIIFAPNIIILNVNLIFIHIISLVWIVFTFMFAYKKKFFSQINSLIIAIAFFIDLILYILSNMTSSLRQNTIKITVLFIIFAESIDLFIIIIIFLGYFLKPNYKTEYSLDS